MFKWWSNKWERKIAPYLFISPFYIVFAAFFVIPIVFAFYLSFAKWAGVGTPKFVGLENYLAILRSADVGDALGNNVWYTVASFTTLLPMAFVLALMLDARWNQFREGFRLIYFLPVVTSVIVIGINFSLLYNPHTGLLNWILGELGLPPVRWLESREWFKPSAMIMIIWRWVGYGAVYFLAGLQNIPDELHEAAEIDGASWLQRLFRITIPLLRPVILFVVIVEIISDFQLFEDIYILSESGGPAEAGITLAMYLYRSGFVYGRLGYASAVGVVLALIIFVVSLIQMRWLGTFREY